MTRLPSRQYRATFTATLLLALCSGTGAVSLVQAGPRTTVDAPALYTELRDVDLRHVGTLRDVVYRHDRVEFHIADAQLYLTEPVAGVRTGAVILGKGRVRVTPPHAVERQQLEKYLDSSSIDLEFKKMVLRFGDRSADTLEALATPGGRANLGEARKQYRNRHKKFLEDQFLNLDARVLIDLLDRERAGPRFFAADIDAKGWFTITMDPRDREEIRIYKSHGSDRARDMWSVFHLERDYEAEVGQRRSRQIGPVRVQEHWTRDFEVPELAVDLALDDDHDVEGLATLRLTALHDTRVTRFKISPVLEVLDVRWSEDEGDWPPSTASAKPGEVAEISGEPIAFVQEHLGRGLREDLYGSQVIVPLPRPLAAGESIRLHVRYRGELVQRLINREYLVRDQSAWYPQHPHTRRSRFHTTFRTPDKHRVASGGEVLRDEVIDGKRIVERAITVPTIGMSFHYGKLNPHVDEVDGEPTFTIYASPYSTGFNPGRRDETIADLRGALKLFTEYFGPAPFDELVIAETPTTGAWAFHGFLLMPFTTFSGMHTGEAEMFRSHELSHQWWGNSVTWDTYHDQWLSEGFASYCAALYAQLALDDEDQFVDMLQAWRKDITGKGDIRQHLGTRNYGYSPQSLRKSQGSRSGPVWIGYRLTSDKTPPDYRILVYEKGAFILHMLRMLKYDWETGNDEPFRRLMRTFHAEHAVGRASTEDFLDAVEESYGEDMLWFFDQWVYGTDMPEYRPRLEARQVNGGWRLQGSIAQSKTSHDFRMPLPVRIHLRDGTTQVVIIPVAGDGVQVDEPLRGPVDRIEVNPLESVLATIR